MKASFLALALLFSFSVSAHISGLWSGNLQWDNGVEVQEIECLIGITLTETSVTIHDSNICLYTPEENTELAIEGSDLYYNGILFGSISGDELRLSSSIYSLSLKTDSASNLTVNELYLNESDYTETTVGTMSPSKANLSLLSFKRR
jgi:hypothetical protein